MGCGTLSVIKPVDEDIHSQSCVFTHHQKHVINKTWKYLANDLTGNGSKVFLKIFQLEPKIKQMFPCSDIDGEELLRNINFKGHASRFMQAVGAVVDNMDDPERELATLLMDLGRQHRHYEGFKPEYFNIFLQALVCVWEQELGKKFTVDARDAWNVVFTLIVDDMKDGFTAGGQGVAYV